MKNRILELNNLINPDSIIDEGIGSKIKNMRKKTSDRREVKSLLSTHKQGLENIKWAQNNGFMDPKISPGKHTYQKAKKSSELRDAYNRYVGKKRKHYAKKVVGVNQKDLE